MISCVNVQSPFADEAIGRVKKACDEHGYVMMVTADHGNAEQMISEKGGPHTAHTTYRGKSDFLHDNCCVL